MARKKPEAMQALDAIKPRCACGSDAIMRDGPDNVCEPCSLARHSARAMSNIDPKYLRQPGESSADYMKRMLAWLKATASPLKKFGVDA